LEGVEGFAHEFVTSAGEKQGVLFSAAADIED
jgi:hypothetical protein